MRPLFIRGGGYIFRARDLQQLVEVGASSDRDDWLMTHQHQRSLGFYGREMLANRGYLRANLRYEMVRFGLATDSRTDPFDTCFDFTKRVVTDEQHRLAHRFQPANLPHVRRQSESNYQRRANRDYRFEIRSQERTDSREAAHRGRIVAVIRHANHARPGAERKQSLGY